MKFINIHIPKCAGTTFTCILKANFKESFIDGRSVLSDRSFKYSSDQVEEILTQFPNCKCFSDHKLSLQLPWLKYDFKVIAFIRDPVERFLSHYRYCRQQTTTCFDPEAKKLDLDEYTEEVLVKNPRQDLRNGQCYHLFGKQDEYDFNFLETLLERELLVLIPLDRFKDACVLLEKKFPNYFKDCSYVRMNESTRKAEEEETLRLREKISSFLEDDNRLWGIAGSSFNTLIDSYSNHFDYLSALKEFNARCSKIENESKRPIYQLRKFLSRKIYPTSRLRYFE